MLPAGSGVSRRAALKLLGLTGSFGVPAWFTPAPEPGDRGAGLSTPAWQATHRSRVLVAHRGSGAVLPEHSMPAYQAAYDWGASCMEVSVGITSDGVLICMHDQTYDRTTTGSGKLIDQPSSVLETIRVWQPQLGARWERDAPRVPLFEDVLRAFGGRVILCVEAKVGEAFEPMMAMVQKYRLSQSVIVKGHQDNAKLMASKAAGYSLFAYLGAPDEVTPDAITDLADQLRPDRDVLVLPGYGAGQNLFMPDELARMAIGTGVPVWFFPMARRSEAEHYFALGAQGVICSSYGYVAGAIPPVQSDSWRLQAVASGETGRSAGSPSYAAQYTPDGELILAAKGTQHFLTLGQFCPIPAAGGSYTISCELSWIERPLTTNDSLSVVFGRTDDSYYEHRQGLGDGYHLLLRANGELALYRHTSGVVSGSQLGGLRTPVPLEGQWIPLTIAVTPESIAVTRADSGQSFTVADATVRGGYVHVGRTSRNNIGGFRNFSIR